MLNTQKGFSLIELMIASAVGLIILLAATTFIASFMRSNGENIMATRLMQDIRTSHVLFAREIKRAGFNRNALRLVSNAQAYSGSFATLTTGGTTAITQTDCPDIRNSGVANASTCLIFSYDRVGVNDGATAPNGQEWKGFRRQVIDGRGVIQGFIAAAAGATPACGDAANDADWTTLTSPNHNITRFLVVQRTSDPIEISTIEGATVNVRDAVIQIEGRGVGRDTGTRRLCETVRVRTDQLNIPAPAP